MDKKVIFVSNSCWNLLNFRLGIMTELKGRGCHVFCCAPKEARCKDILDRGFDFIPVEFSRKGVNPFEDLLLIYKFYKIFRKVNPVIVFNYTIKPNIYSSFAARLFGVKCVNTISGLGYLFISKNPFFKLIKFLYKLSCRAARKTFFHNQEDLNLFVDGGIIRREKTELVKGSGVNTQYFRPDYKSDDDSKVRVFTFLFLGRILWDKGILELIEAVKILKEEYVDFKLNLLGPVDHGNPSAVSLIKIKEWESQGLVSYLGESSDVRPFIVMSDCIVLPSYREGAPRAILEALAMQKPVITTDTAGCAQIIQDGINGLLVPVKNSIALAAAARKMIMFSPRQRDQMGILGREKVLREFDEKLVIEKYIKELP